MSCLALKKVSIFGTYGAVGVENKYSKSYDYNVKAVVQLIWILLIFCHKSSENENGKQIFT